MDTPRYALWAVVLTGAIVAWRSLSGLALVAPHGAGSSAVVIATGAIILAHLWSALATSAALALVICREIMIRSARRSAQAELLAYHAELQADRKRLRERISQDSAIIAAKMEEIEHTRRTGEAELQRAKVAVDHERQELEQRRKHFERVDAELRGAREHIKRLKKRRPPSD